MLIYVDNKCSQYSVLVDVEELQLWIPTYEKGRQLVTAFLKSNLGSINAS